ncbi:TIGR02265 family protein [Cystobacter ferrugineus]|uniref:TIGR02265 family protein n=1 Tax=Cystobacter ferrugineus TaxID=83449 RepID=A0A1L9AZW7_9BACT|nr:TIGR02265 family protein [Cystobacter ferrugineus]OJH35555.1 hypothetical protein BON30_38680 [Cystobacter ferrugineus]
MPSDKNDLAQRIAICKPGDTVRGFLFKSVYGLVEQRVGSSGTDRMLMQLRINKMPVDFFSYPAADFLRMLYTAVDLLEPYYGSVDEATRACGGATVTGFFSSYVGNTLMKLVGLGDPKRVFASVDTIYSTLVSYGKRTSEELGPTSLRLHYRGDMQPITFHEGALREALKVLRGNGTATGKAMALDYGQYVLEWH